MFKNVASQKLVVFAFDSTTNTPKTGDAANITAYVSKDYGSVTVLGDTSATEMDSTNAKGYYLFDLTQAESNADTLLFSAKSSTSNIVVVGAPATVFTVPASWTIPLVTAVTGLTASDVGAIKAKTDNLPASFPSNFAALGITTGGHISNVDTLTTYTGNTLQTGDVYGALTGAQGEPGQGAPAVNASPLSKIAYLFKAWRNKKTQTASALNLMADDASTVDQKATVSDDGTTTTIGEIASGP